MAKLGKKETRRRRHMSIRNRVVGTPERPRLCVNTSNNHIRAQLVDDQAGRTLAAASTNEKQLREAGRRCNVAGGEIIGQLMAERATGRNVKRVVFDRGGFRYHGVVKAVADAAREGGLEF